MKGKMDLRKQEKESKGITLIALVITIIVLLILAAVSIATLTGENGILTKANTSKTETIKEGEIEQIKLAYNAVITEKLANGEELKIIESELQGELDYLNANATARGTDTIKVTFDKTGNVYEVDKLGNVKVSTGTGDEEKRFSFTLDGITCYFDENDEGFFVDSDRGCFMQCSGLGYESRFDCYPIPWFGLLGCRG